MTIEELAARVKRLHAEWMPRLGLGDWEDRSYVTSKSGEGTFGEVEVSLWEYKRLRVCYYPELAAQETEVIDNVIVHELVHVLYAPVRKMMHSLIDEVCEEDEASGEIVQQLYMMHDERATTEVANALIRAQRERSAA